MQHTLTLQLVDPAFAQPVTGLVGLAVMALVCGAGLFMTVWGQKKRIQELEQARSQAEAASQHFHGMLAERKQALEIEIQERIKIEADLRESEEKFRATFDQAAVGIAHLSMDGRYQLVNQKLCDILGYTAAELLNLRMADISCPEDLVIDLQNIQRLLAHEIQAYSLEKRYIRQDGLIAWGQLTRSLVRDREGAPKYLIAVVEDISDRKQAELALQHSNAILNAISITTPTMIYAKDLEGRMLIANPAVLSTLEKPESEVVGKTELEFLPNLEEAAAIQANDRQVIETGEIQVYEETLDLPSGRRSYLSTKSPYRDADGRIIGLIGISTDISDRKCYEEALQAKNREITTIFASISDAVALVDRAWRYIYVNDRAEILLGKTRQELIGNNVWELFPNTQELPGYQFCHQAMAEQVSIQYEEYHPDFDKWLGVTLYPSTEGLAIYFSDITERRQVETALRESEQRFRNLADSMPQLIWTTTPDGIVDYYNQRVMEFSGFSQGPDGSWNWQPVLHPDDQLQTLAIWSQALQSGELYECEHRVKLATGEFRWYLSRGIPVKDQQNQVIKWYGTATDIHAQKQYQAEREELLHREQAARAEAEAASRMKDEFLATLSHELRTPMNSMLGWTVMLRSRRFDESTTNRALETIERNTRSLSKLIDDILDISRIIRGKIHLAMQPVTLESALAAALDTVQANADTKLIHISQDFTPISARMVWGDPTRLQQIFWNLLSNAVKFTPQSGSVEIQTAIVSSALIHNQPDADLVLAPARKPYAQIQIRDTGIGIDPDFLPYVFDRFRQADGSTTRSHGGLGLGLAIVRQLVDLHGGVVKVASPGPEQGSTFTVYLPLLQSSNQAEPDAVEVALPANCSAL